MLHEVGACATEIIGLADTGDYLIAKQPLCQPYGESLEADRHKALQDIKAVIPTGSFGAMIWIFWSNGQPWIVGDLHKGNIRRDKRHHPTIIDALIGPVPPMILAASSPLDRAVRRARAWRESGTLPSDDPFAAIADTEL